MVINIDMSIIMEFILDIFTSIYQTIIGFLTSFTLGNINLFQIILSILLLSFIIPIVITLPMNIREPKVKKEKKGK